MYDIYDFIYCNVLKTAYLFQRSVVAMSKGTK